MKKLIVIVILGLLLTGCADIHAYDAQLAEKDATIAKLQSEIASKDAEIVSLKSELAENPEYISELRFFETQLDLKVFLHNDDTDKQTYIDGEFICTNFALMLMLNAEKRGYRIGMYSKDGHMQNITLVGRDDSLVLAEIEPQNDVIIFRKIVD